jgi:hypothetical protein
MLIAVVNRSRTLSDTELQRAVRAVNRQFAEDFEPYWHFGARLWLEGTDAPPPAPRQRLPGRSRDGVIYVEDRPTIAGAEGFHDRHRDDVPFGHVFLDVCAAVGDDWTVALSHEAIELVGDPMNNLLVQGPHPEDGRHLVFHMFELCDAVQCETYERGGVLVSNFVLPGYFTRGDGRGARNDFLGRSTHRDELPSFGIAPGGYICFYDGRREGDKWQPFTPSDDLVARRRLDAKAAAGGRLGRRTR